MAESVYKVIELVGTSDDSWEKAAKAVARNFKKIPKKLREELTRKLVNDSKSDVRNRAMKIISKNFNDIPEDLRECVLDDLRKYQ